MNESYSLTSARTHLPGIRILYEVGEDAAAVCVINAAVTVYQATG
jgi:hypothetical protein